MLSTWEKKTVDGEVLIVERDSEVGQTVKIMVEATGRRAVSVNTIAEALTELSKNKVDVVLTNCLFMSGGGKVSLPWMAKQIQPEVSVVLTTAGEGINLGSVDSFDGYLKKPFSILDIQTVISRTSRSSALRL